MKPQPTSGNEARAKAFFCRSRHASAVRAAAMQSVNGPEEVKKWAGSTLWNMLQAAQPERGVSELEGSVKGAVEDARKGALDGSKSASPTTPQTPSNPAGTPAQADKWTPTSESGIKSVIANALKRDDGDVSKAFAYLRDLRQQPANYYDSNMAIAADYLRARWETQKCGPEVASAEVSIYMKLKQDGKVP